MCYVWGVDITLDLSYLHWMNSAVFEHDNRAKTSTLTEF